MVFDFSVVFNVFAISVVFRKSFSLPVSSRLSIFSSEYLKVRQKSASGNFFLIGRLLTKSYKSV